MEREVVMDAELHTLKTLSIETYALTLGYARDPVKSSSRVAVLRRDADKLLITRGQDGHWIYRNERSHADHGSIIDFVMHEQGVNLGEARKQLRAWANLPFHPARTSVRMSEPSGLEQPEPDRQKVAAVWNAAAWIPHHPYLLFRQIPRSTLNDSRFTDCWRIDKKGNAVLLHQDLQGPCGYELRNQGFKAMGERTKKGLWLSANIKTCLRLVITESPIDALSFHALHVDATDALWPLGYAAYGGGLGTRQKPLLAALMRRCVDRWAEVIIGVDNDPAGDEYAETLQALSPVALERITPVGKDWNADLCWCVKEEGESWN